MKKFFSLSAVAFILFCKISFGQISLEHVYDHAASGNVPGDQLMIVNFEVYGPHYVKIDRGIGQILIYDLNHTLTKTIVVPNNLLSGVFIDYVMYLSQKLFDIDDGIEYLLAANDESTGEGSTYIFDEDGTQLFYAKNQYPWVLGQFPAQQYPIYNTPQGTKMILSAYYLPNDSAYVYNLPGTLSTFIEDQNNSYLKSESESNLFPNPTSDITHIEYKISPSDLPATMKVYDMNGDEKYTAEIKTKHGFVDFSVLGLANGTYTYLFEGKEQKISSKKFIVIH